MKKTFAIMAAFAALFTMASCDMLEDGRLLNEKMNALTQGTVTPSKAAQNGFEEQVPKTGTESGIPADADVWDVEWDFEGTYWEVSFEKGTRPHGTEYTMYFDLDGNWLATSTEVFLRNVPQNIIDALMASEYAAALDDDEAEFFQTPTSEFYRFEIEIKGRDAEVDVALDGTVTFAGYDD